MLHSDFVHLHLHTNYSLLDGACRISDLIKKANELKFPALAITDHGNMFGAIEFYDACMKGGIKPIIGVEAYLAPKSRLDRNGSSLKESNSHIVLLAKDEEGYSNLKQLVTISYLEGFYYKPRIDKELLTKYGRGLIALTACLKGVLNIYITQDQFEHAARQLDELIQILGKDNVYVEIQDHGIKDEKKVIPHLARLAKDKGVKLVATNDVHYLLKEYASAHDALLAIQTQTTLDDPNRMKYETPEFYLKSAQEMKELFREYPEAIASTIEIADRCNLELEFYKPHLPQFEPPNGKTQEQYLRELCEEGLKKRYPVITDALKQRLDDEFSIIKNAGFISYFLIVWDFVRFAKEKAIPVGPGRGSAAGSIVSYSLGITDIDPLKYDLLFERFLNPQRVSLPDIDIDFCYERRPEVIDYVIKKYGQTCVAQIITFGTMQAKAVVRDVARVMKIPYAEADRLAKLIPNELDITLSKALEQVSELSSAYETNEQVRTLFDTASVLEGLTRHASTHAAGISIADKPLSHYMPLFRSSEGQVTTGVDMSALEKLGVLKIDLLGLRTLTVKKEALDLIKQRHGIELDLDLLSLEDEATFDLFCRAETMGIFQLESSGMRDLLRKLKPSQFEDIIAVLALYRPGPIGSGMLDEFMKRKHGNIPIKYEHPKLEPILKPTYGVIVYQEQVMRIASDLGGFSLAQADILRRAMGKKISEVMENQRKAFVEGCKQNKINERAANRIFDLMEHFAGYGFNKSHSAAYAMISYRTAYLKAHYPVEFMAALLTSEMGNTDKLVVYIDEARRMGINVLPPDVNESEANFSVVGDNALRCGLGIIKNVGMGAIDSIVKARKTSGRFSDIGSLCIDVDLRLANKKVIESLIKAGACDSLHVARASLLASLDQAMEEASSRQRDAVRGQMTFFDALSEAQPLHSPSPLGRVARDWPESQKLAFEKALLGFYISGHPLTRYEKMIKAFSSATSQEVLKLSEGAVTTVGGMFSKIKLTTTKKTNEQMAVCVLEDLEGEVEVLVFPNVFAQLSPQLRPSAAVFVEGRIAMRNNEPRLIAQQIIPLEQGSSKLAKAIELIIHTAGIEHDVLEQLKGIIGRYPGALPVYLCLQTPGEQPVRMKLADNLKVEARPALIDELIKLLGEEAVKVKRNPPMVPNGSGVRGAFSRA